MVDDEHFIPDCDKCPKVELLPDNSLAWMIYQYCASKFVTETQTYRLPFDLFTPPERKKETFEKVLYIHEVVREIKPLNTDIEKPKTRKRR
jgi:hypothetical protein